MHLCVFVMKVVSASEENVKKAAEIVLAGGVVILPTDSVYGIFCDALNRKAVRRVREIKGREGDKPLQVAVRKQDAGRYAIVNEVAQRIIESFWPGDVNIIVDKKDIIPDYISRFTVSLTCHANPVAAKVAELTRKPLVSTSANFAGEKAPIRADEISHKLVDMVDLVLDGGPSKNREANTIIDTTTQPPKIIRSGSVSSKRLEPFY